MAWMKQPESLGGAALRSSAAGYDADWLAPAVSSCPMASRLRRLRARALKAAFAAHTTIYELSDGRIGAGSSFPMLLLSMTGRKTGKTRTTPLVYFQDGDSYVVVGSDGSLTGFGGGLEIKRRLLDLENPLFRGSDRMLVRGVRRTR